MIKTRRRHLLLQRILQPCFRAFFHACARIRKQGFENLPEPPYILFSNHLSWFDPPFVVCFMPVPVYIMAMEGLFRIPPLGFLLRCVGAIPVSRGSLDRRAIEEATAVLSRGGVLLIFPEGGIQRLDKGDALRPGLSLIAQRTNVPIVPVGIAECRDLYRPLKMLRRGVQLTIRVGKPFMLSSVSHLPGKKMRKAVMERVKKDLCTLTREAALRSP
ncbi:MAG: lysophospholipid acyltransferase family protein [Chlamydiota bacterium]